jgi:intracellular septation protein
VLNEIVRREFSVSIWVDFKVFGVIGLHFLFMLAQVPLLMKTQIEDKNNIS